MGCDFRSVESRNLAGDRAKRCDLNVALFGDFFEARVTILELLFLGAQFVVAGDLQQHAGVRAGDAGKAEEADGGADYEYIKIMDWNRDFT